MRGHSLDGRACVLHIQGHRFNSDCLQYQNIFIYVLVFLLKYFYSYIGGVDVKVFKY